MWWLSRKGASGFSASSTAEEVTQGIDCTNLTAIVTGASSGIGVETARVLALRGVHVVMAIRNMAAGGEIKETIIRDNPTAKVDMMELDLSSMESVRKFASQFNSRGLPLNILVNNAGIMATPFKLSKDNIELQFATNHIGHFLLTNLLLEKMKQTAIEQRKEGRIVNVSSRRHKLSYPEGIRFDKINDKSGYSSLSAYGQSKLANVLHANELARRLKQNKGNTRGAYHVDKRVTFGKCKVLFHITLIMTRGKSATFCVEGIIISSTVCQDGCDFEGNEDTYDEKVEFRLKRLFLAH